MTFLSCLALAVAAVSSTAAPRPPPIVGAIRWDAWTEWGYFQQFMQSAQWRDRLPFFAKKMPDGSVEIRCDNAGVMEEEIAYAKKAGINYWAFDWYHPKSQPGKKFMGRCLDLYLHSPHRTDINYCLVLLAGGNDADNHLGPKDEWPATCDYLVERFKDTNYQKALGNRPLVYFFETENWIPHWGSAAAAHAAWDVLRKKTTEAGLGSPFIAVMVFDPKNGVELIDKLGLDAISAYANPCGLENKEMPYSGLAKLNRDFWERCAATGKPFIPTVNAGWDYRPEMNHGFSYRDPKSGWFTPPTPDELAAHVDSAMNWVKKHPSVCTANAVIIYAWNEFNEGGWLAPTLKEGNARLIALEKILSPR